MNITYKQYIVAVKLKGEDKLLVFDDDFGNWIDNFGLAKIEWMKPFEIEVNPPWVKTTNQNSGVTNS